MDIRSKHKLFLASKSPRRWDLAQHLFKKVEYLAIQDKEPSWEDHKNIQSFDELMLQCV